MTDRRPSVARVWVSDNDRVGVHVAIEHRADPQVAAESLRVFADLLDGAAARGISIRELEDDTKGFVDAQ